MLMFFRKPALASVLVTLTVCGCRGDGGGTVPDDLTPQQQAAINAVVVRVEATARAIAGIVDGFAGLDVTGDETHGTCPVVATVVSGGVITATLDFADGCVNPYYGDVPAGGAITLNFNVATRNLAISYDEFTVDSRTVSGAFILQLTRAEDGGRVLDGDIDITTTGVGSSVGTASIQFNLLTDTVHIVSADLTLSEIGGDAYAVSVAGLLMRPIANGNFVPESGTITFGIPNTGPGPATITIVITFKGTTPDDGIVDVTIGTADPVEYQLPGV